MEERSEAAGPAASEGEEDEEDEPTGEEKLGRGQRTRAKVCVVSCFLRLLTRRYVT